MNMGFLKKRVDEIVTRGIEQGQIHGACVSVLKDSTTVHRKAYGMADVKAQKPMKLDSIFRIFSMTKPITSTVTMRLWEEGKIELTDPIHWYIPEFANKKVWNGKELVDAERDITIQDLLNMTSGIVYPNGGNPAFEAMGALMQEMETKKNISTQEFAARVGKDVPLLFQPGERWEYGTGADIMGAILEKAGDMPLHELYKEKLFRPLGMVDTDFYVPQKKRSRLAELYIWDEKCNGLRVEPDPHLGMTDYTEMPAFCSGGAGLVSTLDDYTAFVEMLSGHGTSKNGAHIIGENTWRYMTRPKLTPEQLKTVLWPQLQGYSYGNFLRVLQNPDTYHTNMPAGEFGWDGWTGPYMFVSPQDGTAMVYLIQACNGSNSDIVRRLRTAVSGSLS